MAETKKTLLRYGGKALAGFVRHVASSSNIINDPPDLADRLIQAHPCIVGCWHGQFMMISEASPARTSKSRRWSLGTATRN